MSQIPSDRGAPEEITHTLWTAWQAADIDRLTELVTDDVMVSGYLADGRPIKGQDDVMGMVRDFAAAGAKVDLSELETLSDNCVVFRASVHGDSAGDAGATYWVWTFENGLLKDSHVFANHDTAVSWFAAEHPNA
jgi:ketosteroid isomerase-like protein